MECPAKCWHAALTLRLDTLYLCTLEPLSPRASGPLEPWSPGALDPLTTGCQGSLGRLRGWLPGYAALCLACLAASLPRCLFSRSVGSAGDRLVVITIEYITI